MNKKGFTLIELLAVIVILAILSVVTSTIVFKVIANSKKDTYNDQIALIEKSAEKWALENVNLIGYNAPYCLSVETIKKSGHIDSKTLIDPRDNSNITGYVKITYNTNYKQFEYKYMKNCSV